MAGASRRVSRRALAVVASVLVGALLVGGIAVGLKLRSNITVLDVNDALDNSSVAREATPSPLPDGARVTGDQGESAVVTDAGSGEPLTILVMGSDTRMGQGDGFGSAAVIDGARSDTTLLLQVSADRENVTVVSIPRDLMVTLPACTMADGTPTYPYVDRFNAAFSIGGPECTIRAVTELTGLGVDHFVVVDFTAFERTIDALGGVEVCLTRAVTDPLSGLDLPAGVSRVDGEQGLAFVRSRTSLGDGSDLARIERQQGFLASLVREATSRDLLTDPLRLLRSLDAATQSLTMDAELAWLPHSVAVARSLAGIDPADVSFVTYPNVYNDGFLTVREDPARAALLLAALRADVPWPLPPGARVTVRPDDVTVTVVDATGIDGQAEIVTAALEEQGFVVAGVSTAPQTAKTSVRHPPGARAEASSVAAAVDGASVVRDPSQAGVALVLGSDVDVSDLRNVRAPRPQRSSGAWATPTDERPTGATSTADQATCAS